MPTSNYRGQWFGSQLEQSWAVLFSKLGWAWAYQPERLGCWAPGFRLEGKAGKPLVHVGGQGDWLQIEASSVRAGQVVLLCGDRPFTERGGLACVGWSWRRGDGDERRPVFVARGKDFKTYGLVAYVGGRLVDVVNGLARTDMVPAAPAELEALWRAACNEAARLASEPQPLALGLEAWMLEVGIGRLLPPSEREDEALVVSA